MIRRRDRAALVQLARGIVRGDLMIVDDDPLWVTPLIFMAEAIASARNLGAVLVPVGPHLGGWWVNGKVPGIVVQCTLVAKGDMPALRKLVDEMQAALYPDEDQATQSKET